MSHDPPRILITAGDPNGIGPEIAIKSFFHEKDKNRCHPLIVGCPEVLEKAARLLKKKVSIMEISHDKEKELWRDLPDSLIRPNTLPVVRPADQPLKNLTPGRSQRKAGYMAYHTLVRAHRMIMKGLADALVTCPISKEALYKGGYSNVAHTEILAQLCGCPDPLTLFVAHKLWIAFFTRHLPLRKALQCIRTSSLIHFVIRLHSALEHIGRTSPKLAMAALNPHAGEGGLLGEEEKTKIQPAVEKLRGRGIDIEGPLPADSVFHFAQTGKFDCVIALYHDQGHIAAKTASFHNTVSLTLGLPYIRTSVDHGTGFDIAWQGRACPDSLIAAIGLAVRLSPLYKSTTF